MKLFEVEIFIKESWGIELYTEITVAENEEEAIKNAASLYDRNIIHKWAKEIDCINGYKIKLEKE